jgi:hypothetical protein
LSLSKLEKKEKTMAGEILVVVRRSDRVEEFLPYIEEVAKPGMRVLFLLPYPTHWWNYFSDHWITTESQTKALLEGRKIIERYCCKKQKILAEQRVFAAREAFHKRGVEIAVDVYMGSLRRVIWDCTARGDVHLIVTQARKGFPLLRTLQKMIFPFEFDKRRRFSSGVLVHLNHRS